MSRTRSRRLSGRAPAVATALAAVTATLAGCSILGVQGEGVAVTENRLVEAFDRVDVGYAIALDLRIGREAQVEIRAQPNILPLITTTVEGGSLQITSRDELAPSVAVTAIVVTPSLEGLALSGSSHGTVAGLAAGDLDVDLSGAARLDATGSAEHVRLASSGGAAANLTELSITNLDVDVSGGSSVEASVSDEVRGSASGGARLKVIGDGDVRVDASGGATVDAG